MARKRVINVKSEQQELNTNFIAVIEEPMKHGEIAVIYNNDDAELATLRGGGEFAEFPSKRYVEYKINEAVSAVSIDAISAETARAQSAETALQDNIDEVAQDLASLTIQAYSGALDTNVREAYILTDGDGTQRGALIKIYKDSSLYNVYLGHVDDTLPDPTDPTHTDGSGDTAICFIYEKTDGTYELVSVNVENFLSESEFQDGLVVEDHVVKVKVSSESEPYLVVTESGVTVVGINSAIENAVSAETERAMSAETELRALIEGNLSSITVNGKTADSANTEIVLDSEDIEVGRDIPQSGDTVISSTDTIADALETLVGEDLRLQGEIDAISEIIGVSGGTGETIVGRIENLEDGLADEIERAQSAETELREMIEDALTSVTVNGHEATTDDSDIILDSTDVNVGANVEYSGETLISSADTVAEGFEALVGKTMELEDKIDETQSEIDAINAIIGTSGSGETLVGRISNLEEGLAEEIERATSAETELQEAIDEVAQDLASVTIQAYSGSLDTNVREAYILTDSTGSQRGAMIKIYKDSSLYNVYLGHTDDTLPDPTDPTPSEGSGDTALCFIYEKTDGTYELVSVNVENFLSENEFQDGLVVEDHIVKVKVSPASESFLTVTESGVTLSGISSAIENAVSAETVRATSAETELWNAINASDDKIDELIQAVSAETERAMSSETALQQQIDAALTSVTVNGHEATTADTEIVLDGEDIQVGREIEYSGITAISSGDSVADAFEAVFDQMINNEIVTSEALLELNDRLNSEVERSTNRDNFIQGEINAINSIIGTSGSGETLVGRISNLEEGLAEEIERATSAETQLAGDISAETERALAAEQQLSEDISDETERAISAETELQGAIEGLADDLASLTIQAYSGTVDTNVREAYILTDSTGSQRGALIKIYKDSSLYGVYLGHVDDTLPDPTSPVHTDGSGDTALCFIYEKTDGTYELVSVNVENFLSENEFQDGLVVEDHVVKVKVAPASEAFLTVTDSGVTLSGVATAIESAVSAETERAVSAETEIREMIDDALTSVTVNGKTATTANTVITLDGSDIVIGTDIEYSGVTAVTSAETIVGALSSIVSTIVTDELVAAKAMLELHDDLNKITVSSVTGVIVNDVPASISGGDAVLTLDGGDIELGSNVVVSGQTIIPASSTVVEAFEAVAGDIDEIKNEMEDNNWVVAAAFNDVNYRMIFSENTHFTKNGSEINGTPLTAVSQSNSGETIRTGTTFDVANNTNDVKTTADITINNANPLYSRMTQVFTNGTIPSGTTLQTILIALFS